MVNSWWFTMVESKQVTLNESKCSSSSVSKKHQHRCAPSPGGIKEGGHIAPIYKRQAIEGPSVACLQRGNNENK